MRGRQKISAVDLFGGPVRNTNAAVAAVVRLVCCPVGFRIQSTI
jgi:hypothetical protein